MDAKLKSIQDELRTRGTKRDKILADDTAWREEMEAAIHSRRSEIEDTREGTTACQGKSESRLEGKEPTSVDMDPVVAHQEISREDAALMPVGGQQKRR
jgi:hypothetical protein